MKFGVLTGGGDCPGLNPAIRAVVLRAHQKGHPTIGYLDGWKGVRDGLSRSLTPDEVRPLIGRGGTVLGTSRTNPFAQEEDGRKVVDRLRSDGIDALIAIGGDDTLSAARELSRRGGRVVGVPKTMDNDVAGTDWTFGFHSAVAVAVDAVERLRDTAASHHRAIVLEVMGRHAGWVALATGLASGADVTLLPEEPYDEAWMLDRVRSAAKARGFALVVASEGIDLGVARGSTGAKDEFGHELLREREVGAELSRRIQEATGIESRCAQIGHIQRGGPPELFDRILATRLGAGAVDLALAGRFGEVAVLRGPVVTGIPLAEAVGTTKVVTTDWLDLLHTFDA
ncbi:MAG TPA: ATP-dependent 6-phosphofructokinase [Thermoplasmata archaeon]|nr:ATP-dependent 6-phosphofructokinase [Thermoplasmata archaeon]